MRRTFRRSLRDKVLFLIAWLVLGLAVLGVVVPLLPTTPLLLVASALFARSSPRFDAWLRSTRLYKRYVVPFRETGGMTARKKLTMWLVTAATCGVSFLLVEFVPARVMLVCVVVGMAVALMIKIRTISAEEEARFQA